MNVSVIIPFYNQKSTLRWTVQSVLRQTYKDFELILVDDGSTDETESAHIAETSEYYFVKQDSGHSGISPLRKRVPTTVIYQDKNKGVVKARNLGAAKAIGKFLLFLDGDDWIEPTYLEKTVPLMTGNTGIVYTDMHVFSDDSDNVVIAHYADLETEKYQNVIPNTSLIRREAFGRAGGYKDNVYEDWNLWIDILKQGWKTAILNEPLLHYRHQKSSRITKLTSEHEQLIKNMRELHVDIF